MVSDLVTTLTSFANDVLTNMEVLNLCGAVFLDLSKAFDTVDYSTCILFANLSSLGLTPYAVHWFHSYLIHREQGTSRGNEICDPLLVTCGVPQKSILDPYVQLTVVNLCSVSLYTVYTDAVLFCNYSNIKDLKNALNDDLSKIACG